MHQTSETVTRTIKMQCLKKHREHKFKKLKLCCTVSETWWLQKPSIPHLAQVRHQSWMLNFIYNPNIPTFLVLNTSF